MTATADDIAHPAFIADLTKRLDLRANSLIITIFGDALLPRGGTVWLGSLIELARCFGISERLVRTGVYRLAGEGWLASETRGRRAYYALTPEGRDRFEDAQRRIYAASPPAWEDEWRLVQTLPDITQAERQALRRELTLLGMGQLSPTLHAHPSADGRMIRRTVETLGLADKTVIFRASMEDHVRTETIRRLVRESWALDELARDYATFEDHFRDVPEHVERTRGLTPRDCFALRILLIHDYRRILLKDPQLPDDLLSPDWHGRTARDLCARIYRRIAPHAELYIDETVVDIDGPVGPASPAFRSRFATGARP